MKDTNFMDFLKKNALLFAVIIYAAWMTFTSVDNKDLIQSLEIEKQQAEQGFAKYQDSMRVVVTRKDDQILKQMRLTAESDMTAKYEKNRADKAHKEYEKIKFYAPRNDSERDSLRRAALGK